MPRPAGALVAELGMQETSGVLHHILACSLAFCRFTELAGAASTERGATPITAIKYRPFSPAKLSASSKHIPFSQMDP